MQETAAYFFMIAFVLLGLCALYLHQHNKILVDRSDALLTMNEKCLDRISDLHLEISKKMPLCGKEMRILGKSVCCHRKEGHEGPHEASILWEEEH